MSSADSTAWARSLGLGSREELTEKLPLYDGNNHLLGGSSKTRRGCQNAEYAWRAAHRLHALREQAPEILDLTGSIECTAGDYPDYNVCRANQGVLAELGRIIVEFDKETALRCYQDLLGIDPRPKGKHAARLLRRFRLMAKDKSRTLPVGNVRGIVVAMNEAAREYLNSNPATPPGTIHQALQVLCRMYQPTEPDDPDDPDE